MVDLLARWRRKPEPQQPNPAAQLRVLRASGQRIDLSARDVGMRIAATRQAWQADAWDYHGRIGELAYALRLLAQQVAKVRFYAAEIRPYPDDPAELSGDDHELDEQLAADAVGNLARLPLDDESVDGFLATLCRNLSVAGEAWIHGQPDGDEERWTVRSISEIVANGEVVQLAELPTSTTFGRRNITDNEVLMRCWIRHPRWEQLADSPLSSTLDILEGIVLDGREMREAARSRIAANGLLLVPIDLSLTKTRQDAEDLIPEAISNEEFMADLTEALTAPIRNEGDPGAIAPIMLRGKAEELKEVRHLRLDRADAASIMERIRGGLLRMLKSLDIQPEQVEGLGQTNHWSAWAVDARDVKQQVAPWAATIAGCLTKAFLRPALETLGHDKEQIKRAAVWYDAAGLVENPNRGQDARDAHTALVISDATLRKSLGFDDEDAPGDEELQRRIAARAGVDQGTAALVLEMARQLQNGQPRVIKSQPALPTGPQSNGNSARTAQPGETVPERPTPNEPNTTEPNRGMVAAATPDLPPSWRVDPDLSRALTEIDVALAERIITAADAAIARAIERAGGRARNAVRKDAALTASIGGAEATLVPSLLGRDALLAATTLPDLLSGAFTRLRDQFYGWLDKSAGQVANAVLRLLGVTRQSAAGRRVHEVVTTRLAVHRDAAWTELAAALDAAAERAMFRVDPLAPEPSGRGEESDTLIDPAEVHRALTIAGGGNPEQPGDGGIGTGPAVREALTSEGAVLLGHEWSYRPERPRNTFPPHAALDGARFTTWTDPQLETDESSRWLGQFMRPGDHRGCACASVPLWARPELDDDEGIVSRRLREAATSERGRTVTRVAAEDTAAGRVGTSAQREVETRDRIAADVARLRQHYIEGGAG